MPLHSFRRRLGYRAAYNIVRQSALFDSDWYLARNPDVAESQLDPIAHYLRHGADEWRDPSAVFRSAYYVAQYPGMDPGLVNPLCHYIVVGEAEGAWPNPLFDPAYVRAASTAVQKGSSALLARYLAGELGSIPPSAGVDLGAFVQGSAAEGAELLKSALEAREKTMGAIVAPTMLQPPDRHAIPLGLTHFNDVVAAPLDRGRRSWLIAGHDPQFILTPYGEELIPGDYRLFFDAEALPHEGAGKLYIDSGGGWSEKESVDLTLARGSSKFLEAKITLPRGAINLRFDPTEGPVDISAARAGFDLTAVYALRLELPQSSAELLLRLESSRAAALPIIEASTSDDTARTLLMEPSRQRETVFKPLNAEPHSRLIVRTGTSGIEPPETTELDVRYLVFRAPSFTSGDDLLLFVAYSPDGRLNDLQRDQIAAFRGADYQVVVIVNAGIFDPAVDPEAGETDGLIVRENIGFDFGAWGHALRLIGGADTAASVTISNDSVFPVTGADGIKHMRRRVDASDADILFCTQNLEVRAHFQSYFATFRRSAIAAGALEHLRELPYYVDKDVLIHTVEIPLAEALEAKGIACAPIFRLSEADESGRNPTIHHWRELLEAGCPFWKVQLLTAKIIDPDDPVLARFLGAHLAARLVRHAERRGVPSKLAHNLATTPAPAFGSPVRYNEYGAQNAWNPPEAWTRSVVIPFEAVDDIATNPPGVLAVVHCFYLDVAEEIIDELAALNVPVRLILTTDSEEKAASLTALARRAELEARVAITPNRGRDVAPFLVELAKDGGEEEFVLHLHTKKSKHDDRYADWGQYLRNTLVGDGQKVRSILRMLQDETVGLVYAEHFHEVKGLRNWGFDYENAASLLSAIGIEIDADTLLEFPTSTMFWARRKALQPLLDLGLDYADFDPEEGQIDGTLAHAIERVLLYVCEHQGLRHVKVAARDATEIYLEGAVSMKSSVFSSFLKATNARLLGSGGGVSAFSQTIGEVYPVHFARSNSSQRRLNFLVPTMKPEKIYGGVTTAVATFRNLLDVLDGEIAVRILVTSDDVDDASVKEIASRISRVVTKAGPDADPEKGAIIVDLATERSRPVPLRANDVFFATAWWTADLGFRALDRQREIFGRSNKIVYLIQDFEPGFYSWSNHYALAEATYFRPNDTLAIINSEELYDFMQDRYQFNSTYCIPFALHPRISGLLQPTPKEKIILCYGRPSTPRNCFQMVVEGLRRWQAMEPSEAESWLVIFAGEPFSPDLLKDLRNAENVGKLPIDDYANLLNRAAVGVSLMVSPHPSYPPLEMASAGANVVTNAHENKDLTKRSANFHSVRGLNAEALSRAISEAVRTAPVGERLERPAVKVPVGSRRQVDYSELGSLLWK